MDMKINSDLIVRERKGKAWSQQHLSDVCDVSLRTIQRAEKNGSASYETLKALCSAFDLELKDILIEEPKVAVENKRKSLPKIFYIPLLILGLFGSILITSISSASPGIEIHSKSQASSLDKNMTTFLDEVSIIAPADIKFEILFLKNNYETSDDKELNVKISLGKSLFLVADPMIIKTDESIIIKTSVAQLSTAPKM